MKTTAQTNSPQKGSSRFNRGFTLIELLIVIAVLGVLATVVLVAINPLEQLARGRDSGRIADVTQLGHQWSSWYTAKGGSSFYPNASTTWQSTLTNSSDLTNKIIGPSFPSGASCGSSSTNQQGNICYSPISDTSGNNTNFVIWTPVESNTEKTKITCGTGTYPMVSYYSSLGQSTLECLSYSAVPTGAPASVVNP